MITHRDARQLLEAVNAGYVSSSHPSVRNAVEVLGNEKARSIMFERGKDLLDLAIEDRKDLRHKRISEKRIEACRFHTG